MILTKMILRWELRRFKNIEKRYCCILQKINKLCISIKAMPYVEHYAKKDGWKSSKEGIQGYLTNYNRNGESARQRHDRIMRLAKKAFSRKKKALIRDIDRIFLEYMEIKKREERLTTQYSTIISRIPEKFEFEKFWYERQKQKFLSDIIPLRLLTNLSINRKLLLANKLFFGVPRYYWQD